MIFSTVPDMETLGGSGTRAGFKFSSAILADLVMRGFAISMSTLARILLPAVFLDFLRSICPP